jgi:processive 1,2-diacylglycerol beta-glucosyltransferase
LLPFLRPPKSVVVLGAATGGGHNRTAAALTEALKQLDRNLVVRQHDVLDLVDGDAASVREHLEWLSRDPSLFGLPFETRPDAPPAEEEVTIDFGKIYGDNFDHVVVDKRPDHIVCTHWLPLERLKILKDEGRLKASVSVVIPDPDLHPHWFSEVVTHYLVSHEGLRSRLESRGVDGTKVSVCGSPVAPAFLDPVDKGAVVRTLGLRAQTPSVLFRPGGVGTTERIVALVKAMLSGCPSMNLLVVTGKNERLQEELAALEVAETSCLKVFGFVQNIHELMGIADLLITRASPHTVAEAQAAGVPMLILRPSEGVEDRTADRLLRSGVALKVYGEDDLMFLVDELLKNRRRLRDMQEAAQRRKRPDSVRVTVERLAGLVR